MNWTDWLPPLAVSYALGSVPFSFWIGLTRGVDIRRVGSGNVGATNVFRSVGRPWGSLALLCDVLKGSLAASLVPSLLTSTGSPDLALACGLAAVVGHTWPVTLRFKGGKGVATGAGVLLAAMPEVAAVALAAWIVVFIAFRMVSVASVVAALAAAAASWPLAGSDSRAIPISLSLLALLVAWRHRANMSRIRNGTEPRASFRRGRGAG